MGREVGWGAEASRRTPAGLGHTQEVREAVCGARRRRSRNASCLTEGRKERGAIQGRRSAWAKLQNCRGRKRGGGAPRLQRPGRSWGQRESRWVSDSAGWGGPPGWEAGNREATLLAERRGRRETPDGLGAPPASCGGSRSQSGARAQTSGRQRTPASGPQGPRGERGPRAGGGPGAGPRGSARVHVAEAPPLSAREPPSGPSGSLLAGQGAGRGHPERHLWGKEPQEVFGVAWGVEKRGGCERR